MITGPSVHTAELGGQERRNQQRSAFDPLCVARTADFVAASKFASPAWPDCLAAFQAVSIAWVAAATAVWISATPCPRPAGAFFNAVSTIARNLAYASTLCAWATCVISAAVEVAIS